MPSATRSFRWRISIRSVIPGMLRRSSLVRIGCSERRQRMVPFHRPSTMESAASSGQSEISFLDTGIGFMLTTLSVHPSASVDRSILSDMQELKL